MGHLNLYFAVINYWQSKKNIYSSFHPNKISNMVATDHNSFWLADLWKQWSS
jgi:hypothetical protein